MALLAGCASVERKTASTAESNPFRYLAWIEGEYQTDYQPNREVVDRHLADLETKNPDPSQTDAYLEYLSVLDASGKKSETEQKIKKYLADNPEEKRAVFLLAVHYWRTGKKELTRYFFTQLEKETGFPWKSLLYNNLGMLALQDKNRILAIDYFDKATKSSPEIAAPSVNLGALYLQSRSYSAAEQAFAKALKIDSHFEDAALGLGIALEGQGKYEQAHQAYSRFIEDNSSALSVTYNNSVLLGNRLKRREEAAQMMLLYIQRGGKETAKAHDILQSWR